jgi:L-iditol 2-dehydrogenase
MKVARYMGQGRVEIVDEPIPACPEGGLLVKSEACGLCSGELMDWYMDRKIPHVLGHEVAGRVVESRSHAFRCGDRVFPHHHAPCMKCEMCLTGRHVHCDQWKRTKLVPGGMAEFFAVSAENLTDTLSVEQMRAVDAALIEPVACVIKSISQGRWETPPETARSAVIGLGAMGLIHALATKSHSVGYDLNPKRVAHAQSLDIDARPPDDPEPAETVFVCPGSQPAFDLAMRIAAPGGTIVMFAPLAPGQHLQVPHEAYFKDLRIVHSYSCGPDDTRAAIRLIEDGTIRAEMVISEFIEIDRLPASYVSMKKGETLKPMVVFR